jgi:molecular chaperone DnaK
VEFQQKEGFLFEPTLQQIARLRQAAEEAKKVLSTEEETGVEIVDFTQEPPRNLRLTLTREQFSTITAELVERAVDIAKDVVSKAGLTPEVIDDVVLVGGTTRISAVQEAVTLLFGKRPSKRINPDEAVALGAAQLGAGLNAEFALRDILPMSISRGLHGPKIDVIVPRYTRLPSETELVVSADFLGGISVPLFQGDAAELEHNEYLCTVVVENKRLWDGGEVKLNIAFDEHCVMAVEATQARTGRALPLRLDRSRHLIDVLKELGVPTNEDGSLPPPALPKGGVFERLGRLFR